MSKPTINDVAARLNRSYVRAQRLIREGKLPFTEVGSRPYVRAADVVDYILKTEKPK